jgi:hypothetical protein
MSFGFARAVDLVSQQAYECVEGVFFDLAIKGPHGFDKPARYNSSSSLHPAFQQVVFRSVNEMLTSPRESSRLAGSQNQIANLQFDFFG